MATVSGVTGADEQQAIKGHSGWLVPMAVFVLTAALSGALLLYYLGPGPRALIEERPRPTASTSPVTLTVGGVRFTIPSNYIRYKWARTGGSLKQVDLFAALPDLRGYSDADAQTFLGNAADSPVINMLLHDQQLRLSEGERLQRIYIGYAGDPNGKPGPFGLTQYAFRNDSGYRGEDLFVGLLKGGLVVLRCDRFTAQDQSPSCLRETRVAHHAALSYRFKRSQLSRWREIAGGIDGLMHRFKRGS
jgi:hypothetical protein